MGMSTALTIGGVFAILSLIVFVLWRVKRAGAKEAQGEAAEQAANHAREANETREEVGRMSDDELDAGLRPNKK